LKDIKGVVFVFIGAACFSIKAIIIKLAYAQQIDPITLVTLRMAISLPFFIAVPFIYKKKSQDQAPSSSDWVKILFLGILGYYVATIFDFWGLQHVSAGIERLILFVYPTIVVLLSALFFKKSITKIVLLALAMTYVGIAIIFSDTHWQSQGNLMLGATFIFISAFTYAIYLVGSGRLIPKLGSVSYNAYAMIVSCVAVILHFVVTQPSDIFHLPVQMYYFGIAIALISTVIPTFLIAEGVNLIGAGKAAIVASIGPVITIFLGFMVLHEEVTALELLGTVFVIGGVLLISYHK
jgi:drug/metabolite transporter (DMT)-like permease